MQKRIVTGYTESHVDTIFKIAIENLPEHRAEDKQYLRQLQAKVKRDIEIGREIDLARILCQIMLRGISRDVVVSILEKIGLPSNYIAGTIAKASECVILEGEQ